MIKDFYVIQILSVTSLTDKEGFFPYLNTKKPEILKPCKVSTMAFPQLWNYSIADKQKMKQTNGFCYLSV